MPMSASRAQGIPVIDIASLMQLIQQMQDPNVSTGDVGKLIELDPSLTASLLRLVNSPFFGMRRQIAGVSDAVMVLGMSAVRRMVMSLAVVTPLRKADIDPAFARTQRTGSPWLPKPDASAMRSTRQTLHTQ